MEEIGIVSLWLGKAESNAVFWKILEVEFSEDGDFLGSEFSRAFNIGYYDDSLREAIFFPSPINKLDEALSGVSCEEILIPTFQKITLSALKEINCLILLYDYRHNQPKEVAIANVSLNFIDSINYKN